MMELAVVVMTMNEVGDDRAGRRRGSGDSSIRWIKTVQYAKGIFCVLSERYPDDIWTVRIWTVKFPGDMC